MNINQLMKIWDYDFSKMKNQILEQNGLDALKYLFTADAKYTECMEFESDEAYDNVVVFFNKLTSEVLYIDFCLKSNDSYYIYTTLTDAAKLDLFNNLKKEDVRVYLSENEMLDKLNELVDKDPDEIIDFQIDDNALKTIDAACAVLNITRQDFIAKTLIEQISKDGL